MPSDKNYLVQNLHAGYLGNSPFFWAIDAKGYTAQVDKAERFTEAESLEMVDRDPGKWFRWRIEDVEKSIVTVCDIQILRRLLDERKQADSSRIS